MLHGVLTLTKTVVFNSKLLAVNYDMSGPIIVVHKQVVTLSATIQFMFMYAAFFFLRWKCSEITEK